MLLKLLYNTLIALLALSFIVTIHEFGHYLIARLLNIKIREFSVGFVGMKFLPKFMDNRKTIWRIGLLPLGGYVSFVETSTEGKTESKTDDDIEENWLSQAKSLVVEIFQFILSLPVIRIVPQTLATIKKVFLHYYDEPNQPAEQIAGRYCNNISGFDKIILALAGPVSNFVLAFVILGSLYSFVGRTQPILSFKDSDEKYDAGDVIKKVRNRVPLNREHFKALTKTTNTTPILVEIEKSDGTVKEIGLLNAPEVEQKDGTTQKMSLVDGFKWAAYDCFEQGKMIVKGLLALFTGIINRNFEVTERLSGPVGIIKNGFAHIEKGPVPTWKWIAVLSLSLGVLNLIIIPPFDGGMILLGIIQMLVGKKQKLEDLAGEIAFFVLLFFLTITIRNDFFLKKNKETQEKQAAQDLQEFKLNRSENILQRLTDPVETQSDAVSEINSSISQEKA